ncbi:TKL family protein kinase [Histomonas meleagridis]|uniref:TKL family protein kinase n=1 Tax=Histomonas meleagridis TaxID=135588 RepID=UPI00355A2680|nr:TKL family protein kinase [Histomonas meleagridis]KAH0796625.1 TKL family protein kinase [Histomonas meleagridis]
MEHCWVHYVVNNSPASIATELCQIIQDLNGAAKIIDPEDAQIFDPGNQNWLQFHLLDLRAIEVSFQAHLKKHSNSSEKISYQVIATKMKSIQNFCREYENNEITNTSARIFSPIPIHYSTWKIDPKDLEEKKVVGSGASANVYYGIIKSTKQKVAIKKLKYSQLTGRRFHAYQREITVLATAIHPTLLRFFGATEEFPYCIVTEWMPGGNLYHELHHYHKLDNTDLTICAFDIARGMNFLHSRQIVHRDLKSLNVLLDDKKQVKICDFGFSRKIEKKAVMTKNIGTPHWMAPEILNSSGRYDTKVDVYSYGIVLWEILTHKTPYQGIESDAKRIIQEVITNDIRPTLSETDCGKGLYKLITTCWARDPNERPTFKQILEYFKSGEIFYPNADMNVVMKHITESLKEDAKDIIEIKEFLDRCDDDENPSLEEFINIASKEPIPNDYVQACWNILTSSQSTDPALMARGYTVFLKTRKALEASQRLRNMENGTIPQPIIQELLQYVPTGNDLIDENIIISACKNNEAEEALMWAFKPTHVQLAMEILSRTNIKPEYEGVITARCMLSLTLNNVSLSISALRCLLKLGQTKNLALSILTNNIQSKTESLRNATYVAIGEMALNEIEFPSKFVDLLVEKAEVDRLAVVAIGKICSKQNYAEILLERFQHQFGDTPIDVVFAILMNSKIHQDLKQLWDNVFYHLKTIAPDDYRKKVNDLEAFI